MSKMSCVEIMGGDEFIKFKRLKDIIKQMNELEEEKYKLRKELGL